MRRLFFAFACFLGFALPASAAVIPWHNALDLAHGGYWTERIAVTVTNLSAQPLNGRPLSVELPALAGADLKAVRACRSDGVELLFEVRDARGKPKRDGQ